MKKLSLLLVLLSASAFGQGLKAGGSNNFVNGMYLPAGQKICLDGTTCAKYLTADAFNFTVTGVGLKVPSLSSISFGSTSYGIIDGVANNGGLCLNQAGANGSGPTAVPIMAQIYKSVTAASNGTTVETTLDSYAMPTSTLDKLARSVRIHVSGTFAANANTKTVRLKFGATDLTGGAFTGTMNGGGYEVECVVRRIGATTQTATCHWGATSATPVTVLGKVTAPGETLANAITIAHTGQSGTASSDITSTEMYVEYLP